MTKKTEAEATVSNLKKDEKIKEAIDQKLASIIKDELEAGATGKKK
ncbi:MAG: hypothetical protein JWP25_4708 [Bradyrhizobium sp.]|nr:hypothetical protein [Bradyrhizobium sp.]